MNSGCERKSRHKVLRGAVLIIFTSFAFVMFSACAEDIADLYSADGNSGVQDSEESLDFSSAVKNEDFSKLGIDLPLTEPKVISLSVKSKYMGGKAPCKVCFPRGYGSGEDYPVWYGLHGSGCDENMWLNEVSVVKSSDQLIEDGEIRPMIVVFPYTIDDYPAAAGDDENINESVVDQYIYKELVPYIDSRFDTISSSDGRFIGGFSMGGMVALRIAFHHPEMFSKIGGYSAAVLSNDFSDKQLEEWLFPYENTEEITDVISFVSQKGLDKLSVYLDCGTNNDPFFEGVQSLHGALQKRGIQSEFHSHNGGHDLEYAKVAIKEYLKFYTGK